MIIGQKIGFAKQPDEPCVGPVLWLVDNLPIVKSIDPGQPARTARADLGRYFLNIELNQC